MKGGETILNNLEVKRKESLIFQKAQHIVALLEGFSNEEMETTFKLAKEIRQSDSQKAIAIFSYRQK